MGPPPPPPAPAPLLVTTGGHQWRPVQTCSLEDPPRSHTPPLPASDTCWPSVETCSNLFTQGPATPSPAPLVVTPSGHQWRPVQTCLLEVDPPPQVVTSGGH